MDEFSIGQQIKQLRLDKGLTLQELAEMVDLTASHISQIENAKSSPSLATLKLISRALGCRLIDFFADELVDDPVITSEKDWTQVHLPGWESASMQMVRTVGYKRMQPFYTVIPPGGCSREAYAHVGDEFGFVLEGELTLFVGGEEYKVPKKTAFYYSSVKPHSWRNDGDVPCSLIWVNSPPTW